MYDRVPHGTIFWRYKKTKRDWQLAVVEAFHKDADIVTLREVVKPGTTGGRCYVAVGDLEWREAK